MQALEPPDSHFLSAADGWLGLGNLAEAMAELDRISPAMQEHPIVLDVRWGILARQERWAEALLVARRLLGCAPQHAAGWLHQAYALRRAPGGGLQAAWDALFPAMEKFPGSGLIPYNLACYACQMKQLDVARIMFHRAQAAGEKTHFKEMALQDEDLRPLWDEIRGE